MAKTHIRGKLKGLFFVLQLDRIIPAGIFQFTGYMSHLSRWIRKHKHIEFCDFYTAKRNYEKRLDLFDYVISTQKLEDAIDYLEFGVSKGSSFKWWMERIKHKDARFYGFDTFTGLPEDWGPFKAGDMDNGNKPPEIDDNRHSFYQGLFQQTLIPFLAEYKSTNRKVIHMDADIYSATLYVLTLITPYLNPGDIIFFDEFNVPMHEFKAFSEWQKAFYIKVKVLGSVNNFYQTAFMVED
ncbi:class I SAM-dependent methyltransferase [Bacteroidota bacterium]